MHFVRKFVLMCLEDKVIFRGYQHIKGSYNVPADSLSGLQIAKFMELAPGDMDKVQTDIPFHLPPQNWHPQCQGFFSLVYNLLPCLPSLHRYGGYFGIFFHNNCYPEATISLPFSLPTLALFIEYMFDHNNYCASSTETTYILDLGYFDKLHGHDDQSKNFFISQMMKGYSKIDYRVDNFISYNYFAASCNLAEPHSNITLFFLKLCVYLLFTLFQNR